MENSIIIENFIIFQADRMGLGGDDGVMMTEPSEPINDSENGGQKVYDDETEMVTYNYR